MELFKTLFCNMVYYHRHSGNWGHYDMPIFASFVMIWICVFFLIAGTLEIFEIVLGINNPIYTEIIYIVPIMIVAYLYYRMVCKKRYFSILRNRKYYTKRRRIFTLLFFIGCLLYYLFTIYLMWTTVSKKN